MRSRERRMYSSNLDQLRGAKLVRDLHQVSIVWIPTSVCVTHIIVWKAIPEKHKRVQMEAFFYSLSQKWRRYTQLFRSYQTRNLSHTQTTLLLTQRLPRKSGKQFRIYGRSAQPTKKPSIKTEPILKRNDMRRKSDKKL